RGDQPGARRTEAGAGFPFYPLASAFYLEFSFGNIVHDKVPSNGLPGLGFAFQVEYVLFQDKSQLDFPVGLAAALGNSYLVIGTTEGIGRLHKEDGFLRCFHSGLGGVVGKVEAYTKDHVWSCHTAAPSLVVRDLRKVIFFSMHYFCQFFQTLPQEEFPVPVLKMGRAVVTNPIQVNTRFFVAPTSKSYKFHISYFFISVVLN